MWQIPIPARSRPDVLRMQAEQAGLAWACPFSSSAEFEAAVIKARRRAGAFRWVRIRRYAIYTGVLATAAVATAGTYLLI